MTRRAAILSTVAVAAALTESARAQDRQSLVGFSTLNLVQSLSFPLRAYRSYTFSLDGESITLTPEEMFAAIKGEK